MGNSDILACVREFLIIDQRPTEEPLKEKHFWHFRPASGNGKSMTFLVIDIDKDNYSDLENLPHEVYLVEKKQDKM
ncbi:hypothetical protein N7451_008911 [Penicillium sp. IBT 35674x]|nr:hypothetical protein N7451_008911 [Penicillium sp. IBT 35674x]